MGLEFIDRIIRTSLVVGAIIVALGSFYFDWNYSLGIFIGLLFSCANFWLTMGVVRHSITVEDSKRKAIIIFTMVKFPVLYTIGYLILRTDIVPVSSLLVGFTLLFGIILLKVLGQLLMNSDIMRLAESKEGASR